MWERVKEPDDPRRCQAVVQSKGQCLNYAVDNCDFCIVHGGSFENKRNEEKSQRMYNLGKWRARASEFQDHDKIKSLREEIGILRVMIDEKVSACHTPTDLMLYSGPLTDMIMKVEKLVTSCSKLELHLGGILDKTQALQLGQEMVEIIGRHLDQIIDKDGLISKINSVTDDPEIIEVITDALADYKNKDAILEGISDDIVSTVERLGKTG